MVLHDDFSIPEGWQTGVTAAGSIAFGQKELSLAVTGEKATLVSLREDPIPGNAYVEMNVLPSLCNGEDSFGLLLRSASHSTGYRLAGTCDGRLRMERLRNGEVLPLEDWSPAGTLPAGGGIPVTLGVWMNANELRVFVDQQWQFTVRDPVWSEGQVGVFARSAASGPLTVNFSSLSVYAIDTTRLLTATPAP